MLIAALLDLVQLVSFSSETAVDILNYQSEGPMADFIVLSFLCKEVTITLREFIQTLYG